MADSTIDITQPFDRPQKLLRVFDNGDGTYSVASMSRIVDADGHQVNVQAVADALDGTEYGAVTNAIIHGKSTAGGGTWVDVKVTPSGALTAEVDIISEPKSATATASQVADSASSVTILASNANRLGATIANDSSAVLYLLLGSGTASATNYTVRIAQYGYYEVPFRYTGQITGIWASDPGDGAARVTELT